MKPRLKTAFSQDGAAVNDIYRPSTQIYRLLEALVGIQCKKIEA